MEEKLKPSKSQVILGDKTLEPMQSEDKQKPKTQITE